MQPTPFTLHDAPRSAQLFASASCTGTAPDDWQLAAMHTRTSCLTGASSSR